MSKPRVRRLAASVMIVLIIGGIVEVVHGTFFAPKTIIAYFSSSTGLYKGDGVRVSGVEVGRVAAIEPEGSKTKLTLDVDRDVPIPADVKAVIVSQSLIAARYVQLTPAYEATGSTMRDGGVVPLERTAVPVEWDQVKEQLTRLATELGPTGTVGDTSVSRFIDRTANAMDGNGEKLRQTLTQLSGVGRILAAGGGDIVAIIKNLSTFIGVLRDSNTQIVQFQDRLATLSSVLDGSRSDLDAALTNVSEVLADVRRFVGGSRNETAEQVQRLANITRVIVDHQRDLEQLLHVAPTGIANTLNFFDPRDGGIAGVFALNNFANPMAFICSSIGAIENVTATETSKLCSDYLGPALRTLNFNYLPVPLNPTLAAAPPPQDYEYSEPQLAPGGSGPSPTVPSEPPTVSAYTGLNGDQAPPPGYVLPAPPHDLPDMLLPPPTPSAPAPGPLLPAEATPGATAPPVSEGTTHP